MNITYNEFKTDHTESLIHLWEVVFRKEREKSINIIKWILNENKGYIYVAINSQKVIGSRVAWIWNFELNNKKYKALQFGLTCVSPEYRRLGVFSNLNNLAINVAIKDDIDFIFNVSLENAKKGYEKMGWKYNKNMLRIVKFNFNLFNPKKNKFLIYNSFEKKVQEKFLKYLNINNHFLHPIHDINFYKQNFSYSDNTKFFIDDFNIIIYKVDKKKYFSRILIGEIISKTKKISDLERSIKSLCAYEKKFIILYYLSKNNWFFNISKKLNFYSLKNPYLNLGIKSLKKNLEVIKLERNINLTYIDLDTFYQ